MVFPDFDASTYTADNNLSLSFQLNNITAASWSSSAVTVASNNGGTGAVDQIQFTGPNPAYTDAGPGQSTVGTLTSGFGYGLYLNPSSGLIPPLNWTELDFVGEAYHEWMVSCL